MYINKLFFRLLLLLLLYFLLFNTFSCSEKKNNQNESTKYNSNIIDEIPQDKTIKYNAPDGYELEDALIKNLNNLPFATSSFESNSYGDFDATQAFDGKLSTAWVEGFNGDGIGQILFFESSNLFPLEIFAGFGNEKTYFINNRLKSAYLYLFKKNTDGIFYTTKESIELEDEFEYQEFDIFKDNSYLFAHSNKFYCALLIKDVYPGKDKDTSIAEIRQTRPWFIDILQKIVNDNTDTFSAINISDDYIFIEKNTIFENLYMYDHFTIKDEEFIFDREPFQFYHPSSVKTIWTLQNGKLILSENVDLTNVEKHLVFYRFRTDDKRIGSAWSDTEISGNYDYESTNFIIVETYINDEVENSYAFHEIRDQDGFIKFVAGRKIEKRLLEDYPPQDY